MSINMRARAVMHQNHPSIEQLSKEPVYIARIEPRRGQPPMFVCVDSQGDSHHLYAEEVRNVSGSSDPDQEDNPLAHVGGKPITDLHPLVVKTLHELADA